MKRGLTPLITIPLAVVVLILALALSPTVKFFVDDARNSTSSIGDAALDCDNAAISNFDDAACIATDLYIPAFLGVLIGIAGVIVGARLIFRS